jgi:hypothetical protein
VRAAATAAAAAAAAAAFHRRLQLLHGVWPEILHEPLQRIVQAARLAASLQPDGTGLPEVRFCCVAVWAWLMWNCIICKVPFRPKQGLPCGHGDIAHDQSPHLLKFDCPRKGARMIGACTFRLQLDWMWHQLATACLCTHKTNADVLCLLLLQEHCTDAITALHCITKHWWDQMQLLTVTESNAEVLAAGAVSAADLCA